MTKLELEDPTLIPEKAYIGDSSLQRVEIPDGVRTIGD